MKTKCWRHGEVVFQKISKLPKGLKSEDTNIIMKGSHGHDHTFKSGKIYLKQENNFVFGYFRAKDTLLFHDEHGKKTGESLPNGNYKLIKQQEFVADGLRPVID